MQMTPLNPAFPFQRQMESSAEGPVVLVNLFVLDVASEEAFLNAWTSDAA